MIEAVDKGKIDVGKAAKIAKKMPKAEQAAAVAAETTTAVDRVGNQLTTEQSRIFGDEYLFDDLIEHLAEVRRGVKALRELPAGNNLHLHRQLVNRLIRELASEIEASRPYAICPYCEGRGRHCGACQKTGIAIKKTYDGAPKSERAEV